MSQSGSSLRSRLHRLIEVGELADDGSRLVDRLIILLIAGNVLAVVLESVSALSESHALAFARFELFSVAVFSVEYVLRIWTCPEAERWNDGWRGRLRWARQPIAIVDILAILPCYLSTIFGVDLRFLRMLRILRTLKLTRYSPALTTLLNVFREEGRAFATVGMVFATILLLASSGIHYVEAEAQPEAFGSIPASMWWTVATLTTVGYGDVTPITPLGKLFAIGIMITGVAMVALPAGLIASGFSDQIAMRRNSYERELLHVLEDGVISDDELAHLEDLRSELGVTEHEADDIAQGTRVLARAPVPDECPHCGKSLAGDG